MRQSFQTTSKDQDNLSYKLTIQEDTENLNNPVKNDIREVSIECIGKLSPERQQEIKQQVLGDTYVYITDQSGFFYIISYYLHDAEYFSREYQLGLQKQPIQNPASPSL